MGEKLFKVDDPEVTKILKPLEGSPYKQWLSENWNPYSLAAKIGYFQKQGYRLDPESGLMFRGF